MSVAGVVAGGGVEADELSALIFPTGVPTTVEFYDHLRLVEWRLGFSDAASTLAGELGALALKKVPELERIKILRCLLAAQNLDFFGSLRALPVFIERVGLPAEFLLPWFVDVRARIGNDFPQGAYWRSLEVWALKHPSSALEGLRLLCNQDLNDDKISIGACLLGHLRVAWEKETLRTDGIALEATIAQNSDVQKRLIFHRSWINTGWHRGLSREEFTEYLKRISNGTAEERLEGFNFLRCLLPTDKIDAASLDVGLNRIGNSFMVKTKVDRDCRSRSNSN